MSRSWIDIGYRTLLRANVGGAATNNWTSWGNNPCVAGKIPIKLFRKALEKPQHDLREQVLFLSLCFEGCPFAVTIQSTSRGKGGYESHFLCSMNIRPVQANGRRS